MHWNESISAGQVANIASAIDSDGFCQIDDFLSSRELEKLAAFAQDAITQADGEYVGFSGIDAFSGTVWAEMASSPTLASLCSALYHHATGGSADDPRFYQIFRCLAGHSAKKHSFYFHYDSYILTIVVPIVVPNSGSPGDLIVFPARRPIRKSYWRNVIDKLIADRWLMQRVYRLRSASERTRAIFIPMVPGSAVIFWGYRSLHANEPCDPDQRRVTALLHYGNFHRAAVNSVGTETRRVRNRKV